MFASEKVMLEYLSGLLSEEQLESYSVVPVKDSTTTEKVEVIGDETLLKNHSPTTEPDLRPITSKVKEYKEEYIEFAEPSPVEKLLQQVELKQQEEKITKEQSVTVDLVETEVKSETQTFQQKLEVADEIPDEPFQALFFEVSGLILAVPLQELGGIHNLTETNSLFGKPPWFKGVMLNREKKLNVVDSALWVMPEKYDSKMEESIEYKYLITLGQSEWGLAAEKLVETELIQPDAVKWRIGQGKRPWLFGTIKEKMCALLHVSDLIAMLEQGVDSRQQ